MNFSDSRQWLWLPMAMLLIAAAVLTRPAMPVDETRYLSVAWEMWRSGDFLVPHSNGLPYSHKPPLLFWLINFGWWLLGEQEWSARLTGPLCGVAALFLTRLLAGDLFPRTRSVQLATPYILLGMLCWSFFASLTMFDTLMSCMALSGYLAAYRGATGRLQHWWLPMGLAIGGGVLAKGPIILVYTVPALLLAPWWARPLQVSAWRWYGQVMLAIAVGGLVALSWALPAAWAGGREYGDPLLFGQTAGRMVKAFDHQRPFYFYLLVLPAMLFPWSVWPAIWRGLFSSPPGDAGRRFLLAILLPGLVILSLVSAKQIHYMLPLLPAAAILIAAAIDKIAEEQPLDRVVLLIVWGLVTLAVAALPLLPIRGSSARFISQLPVWLGLCPLAAFLPFIVARGEHHRHLTPLRTAVATTLFFIGIHLGLSTPLNANYRIANISRALAGMAARHQTVAVYPRKLDDQFHFTGRLVAPVVPLRSAQEVIDQTITAPESGIVINLKEPTIPKMPAGIIAEPYKGGWLLLVLPQPQRDGAIAATLASILQRG
ncbi:MAG: ArnT family glycosyltransferase [Desulfopila sp.]